MSEFKITPEMVEAASVETERLTRELDIMNADHIALWLEANDPYDGDAWLAIQIIEAHERATTTLRAENELMREVVSDLLPRGVCWDNPNIPDNTVIPVDMTMGEIRKARNALAQVGQ